MKLDPANWNGDVIAWLVLPTSKGDVIGSLSHSGSEYVPSAIAKEAVHAWAIDGRLKSNLTWITEADWQSCNDPNPMLRFLIGNNADRIMDVQSFPTCKGSDRKLRLFACSCYRRIQHLLPDEAAKGAVGVAERFADGLATREEMRVATDHVQTPIRALEEQWRASKGAERIALEPMHAALALAQQIVRPQSQKAAYYASSNAYLDFAAITNSGKATSDKGFRTSQRSEEQVQSDLLRCIFGNPFNPVSIDRSSLSSIVTDLAQTIYHQNAFEAMLELADHLEKSGCTNKAVLEHCRRCMNHARGCWVIDLLLGKQ